jgi:hypothetical protein
MLKKTTIRCRTIASSRPAKAKLLRPSLKNKQTSKQKRPEGIMQVVECFLEGLGTGEIG